MQLGVSLPVGDIGTDPTIMRDYAQAAEGLGYSHLLAARGESHHASHVAANEQSGSPPPPRDR